MVPGRGQVLYDLRRLPERDLDLDLDLWTRDFDLDLRTRDLDLDRDLDLRRRDFDLDRDLDLRRRDLDLDRDLDLRNSFRYTARSWARARSYANGLLDSGVPDSETTRQPILFFIILYGMATERADWKGAHICGVEWPDLGTRKNTSPVR